MNNVDIGRYSKKIASLIWDNEPKNNREIKIWCLGRQYDQGGVEKLKDAQQSRAHPRPALEAHQSESSFVFVNSDGRGAAAVHGDTHEWPAAFLEDFGARFWFTYRHGFPPIPRSDDPRATRAISLAVRMKNLTNQHGFISDTGWGCMIRSGQCLLANALALSKLGRDWTRPLAGEDEVGMGNERTIISLFADDPRAPFSIHNFVNHGAQACGTFPGQWFGPSATAKCIEALSIRHPDKGLTVYATDNSPEIYTSKLYSLAKPSPDAAWHPTLLLVGTRLGIDHVTPVYRQSLMEALRMPQAVGIAGGRPSSSHYFVGLQGSKIFYLDPHTTQSALPYKDDGSTYSNEQIDTYHTQRLRCLPIEDMDPSMLIGFLLQTERDWQEWRRRIETQQGKRIFHIIDSDPPMGTRERESAVDEVSTFDTEDEAGFDDEDANEGQASHQYAEGMSADTRREL